MKEKLSLLLGFSLLFILLYLIYKIASWLSVIVNDINPNIAVALIAATATATTSVFIASYNSRKAKEKIVYEAHRGKKAEIYESFLDLIIDTIKNSKSGKEGEDLLPKDVEDKILTFTSKITVYGGPKVVKAFIKWKTNHDNILILDELFKEMRIDLGESNLGIEENELLGLYVIGGKEELEKFNKKND